MVPSEWVTPKRATKMLEMCKPDKKKTQGAVKKQQATPKRPPTATDGPADGAKRARLSDEGLQEQQAAATPVPPTLPRKGPLPLAPLPALRDHDVTPLMRPQPGDAFRRDNSTLTELSKPPAYARFQQVYQRRLALMQGQRPWGMAGAPAGRPVGMVNLGNTCYLNAVLQVLLSLPSFVGDLRRATKQMGAELLRDGVAAALLECVAAKEDSCREAQRIVPVSLKRAMGARMAAFEGAFQQDAHEFFCGLLDVLQGEVLAVDAGRLGRQLIRISETADPAARSFSFAVSHQLTCSQCQHESSVTEEYLHLSLEVPQTDPGSVLLPDVNELLLSYFKDEELVKRCERCGVEEAAHRMRHTIKRLPRVLALHMKRFQLPATVQLVRHVTPATLPPLAVPPAPAAGGKENHSEAANLAAVGGSPAAVAAVEAKAVGACRQGPQLGPSRGLFAASSGAMAERDGQLLRKAPAQQNLPNVRTVSFYNTSASKGHASVLDLFDGAHTPPHTRQLTSPRAMAAADALGGLGQQAETEDDILQRVLRESALQYEQDELQRASGGRPASSNAREPATEQCSPMAANADVAGDGSGRRRGQLPTPHWRALERLSELPGGTAAGCRMACAAPAVAAREPPVGTFSQEDEDLQRALHLSMLEQQGCRDQPAGNSCQLLHQQEQPWQQGAAGGGAREGLGVQEAVAGQRQRQWQPQQDGASIAAGQRDQAANAAGGFVEPVLLPPEHEGACSPAAQPAVVDLCTQAGDLGSVGAGLAEGSSSPIGRQEACWGSGAAVQPAQAEQEQHQGRAPVCLARIVEDDADVGDKASGSEAQAEDGAGRAREAAGDGPQTGADTKKPAAAYVLHAIIKHAGTTALSGHFTADIRSPVSGSWHEHNDSWVRPVGAREATGPESQQQCYMVFYVYRG
ncbi:hypothetical protein N2152v2_007913 [Parachlorella kessleri]